MEKKIIVVGYDSIMSYQFNALNDALRCESNYFRNNTIVNYRDGIITTPKCKILFKYLYNIKTLTPRLRSLKADACFNVSKEIQCQINKDNKPTDLNIGLMEYIIATEKGYTIGIDIANGPDMTGHIDNLIDIKKEKRRKNHEKKTWHIHDFY